MRCPSPEGPKGWKDNGKENGNYYSILFGLYWDNGKENGNYYSILFGLYWDNGKENGNYMTFNTNGPYQGDPTKPQLLRGPHLQRVAPRQPAATAWEASLMPSCEVWLSVNVRFKL